MKIKLPFVVLEITPRCNLSCKYCYNIWKMPGKTTPKEAGFSKVKKALKRLFQIVDVDHITFSGGEPFVFPRMAEIALFCRMKKKGVTIISNGYKGTCEEYEMLLKMGVQMFEFPIHSYEEETHDRIAGRKGAWKRSVDSVKTVLELKGQVVVVIVITKLNGWQVPKTMAFIKSLGINRIMLNRFNIGGQGIKEKEVIGLTNSELKQIFKKANKAVNRLRLTVTSNVCTPYCVINPELYKSIGFSACYPKNNNRPWTLDPDGNIRFCNHSPHVIGNIFKNTFEEMLASPYVQEWRNTVPEICTDCSLFNKCWAGCRAASEQLGMPLSCADPIVYDEFGQDMKS